MTFEDTISGRRGPIVAAFRVDLRNTSNVLQSVLPAAALEAGSVTLDNDRAIMRTCSLTLRADQLPDSFDSLTSLIGVHMDIAGESFQLGLFRLTTPVETYDSTGEPLLQVAGSDNCFTLQKAKSADTYEIPAGTNYIEAVRTIVLAAGLPESIPSDARVTPVAFTWAPGTPFLAMVNQLLIGVNHHEVFANETGALTSRGRGAPITQPPNVHYRNDSEPRLISGSFQRSRTEAQIPNVLVGLVQDPNRALIAATVSNSDPASPWSITATPAQWASLNIDRVADITTLAEVTEYELRLATGAGEPAQLGTVPDPRRGAHEVYRLTINDRDGNPIEDGSFWRVRGWTISLIAGEPMRHNLQAARPLVVEVVTT